MLRNLIKAWWAELAGERAVQLVVVAATIAMYGWAASLVLTRSMTLGTFLALIEYLNSRAGRALPDRRAQRVGAVLLRTHRTAPGNAGQAARNRRAGRHGNADAREQHAGAGIRPDRRAGHFVVGRIRSWSEDGSAVAVPPAAHGQPSFRFDGVHFRYSSDGAPVLDGLDLSAEPRERIALVGKERCRQDLLDPAPAALLSPAERQRVDPRTRARRILSGGDPPHGRRGFIRTRSCSRTRFGGICRRRGSRARTGI